MQSQAAAKVKPHYVLNRLGRKQLIDDENHLYIKDKSRDLAGSGTREYWYCNKKNTSPVFCKATAIIMKPFPDENHPEGVEWVVFNGHHAHYSNPVKVKAQELDRRVLQDALENL